MGHEERRQESSRKAGAAKRRRSAHAGITMKYLPAQRVRPTALQLLQACRAGAPLPARARRDARPAAAAQPPTFLGTNQTTAAEVLSENECRSIVHEVACGPRLVQDPRPGPSWCRTLVQDSRCPGWVNLRPACSWAIYQHHAKADTDRPPAGRARRARPARHPCREPLRAGGSATTCQTLDHSHAETGKEMAWPTGGQRAGGRRREVRRAGPPCLQAAGPPGRQQGALPRS